MIDRDDQDYKTAQEIVRMSEHEKWYETRDRIVVALSAARAEAALSLYRAGELWGV
jgi:hypothetical protein